MNQKKFRGRPNRGRLEIFADILESSKEEQRKTPLMYKANLTFKQLLNYLYDLQDRRLIEQLETGVFRTTERGRAYLQAYGRIAEMFEDNPKGLYES